MFSVSNQSVFFLIKNNFKWFLITGVLAIILGVVFSSPAFIPPREKSKTILYPMNIEPYSDESATEQMLQLLESNEITDALIEQFDLYKKYDIDSTEPGSRYLMLQEIKDNIQIAKTSYESVIIEVTDYNPKDAKAMIDSIIAKVNQIATRIERQKAKSELKALSIIKKQKGKSIDNLLDSIKYYGTKYNLLDYIMQSKEVTAGYMELLTKNVRGKSYDEALHLYKNLEQYGRKFLDFHHRLSHMRSEYAILEKEYDEALKKMEQDYIFTNVIVLPEVPDKKTYPVRWLIVLVSFIVSEIMLLVVLLFKSQIDNMKTMA